MNNTLVIIPNWNGVKSIGKCLSSLKCKASNILVIENGSIDGSLEFIKSSYPDIRLIINKENLGFAGGVNQGLDVAINENYKYAALLNNDAIANKDWLENLVNEMENNPSVGIATSKILSSDGSTIDSTGDLYTNWGLPFPRGRKEKSSTIYDQDKEIFAASGGASIYRIDTLKEVGLFDEDFFAYYEDVDISFRAQLAGWKIQYVPSAIVFHQIGATSKKIKGFTTYQTMKNLPLLFYKNVPRKYFFSIGWRLGAALFLFLLRSLQRKDGFAAIKGLCKAFYLIPKKTKERNRIQTTAKVSNEYIWTIITHDLPPNAKALRKLKKACGRMKAR